MCTLWTLLKVVLVRSKVFHFTGRVSLIDKTSEIQQASCTKTVLNPVVPRSGLSVTFPPHRHNPS
jgi:hypothetical protein